MDELPDVTRWGPVICRYEANGGALGEPDESSPRCYFAADFGCAELLLSRAVYDDLPRLARLHGRILVDERRDGGAWHRPRISTR